MADPAVYQKRLRSRSYSIEDIQIGTFHVDATGSNSTCTNKIRIFFVQKVIIYDFEFDFWVEDTNSVSKLLVAVCIPFDTLTGVCCKSKDLYFTMSKQPRLVVGGGSQLSIHQRPHLNDFDITNGQLAEVLFHKVTLKRAQGFLVRQHLLSYDVNFSNLFADLVPQATTTSAFEQEQPEYALDGMADDTLTAMEDMGENLEEEEIFD